MGWAWEGGGENEARDEGLRCKRENRGCKVSGSRKRDRALLGMKIKVISFVRRKITITETYGQGSG